MSMADWGRRSRANRALGGLARALRGLWSGPERVVRMGVRVKGSGRGRPLYTSAAASPGGGVGGLSTLILSFSTTAARDMDGFTWGVWSGNVLLLNRIEIRFHGVISAVDKIF
jgi:hypothetical protein